MNADRLLEHFERISDAADAVPRLRRFVLDLAVQGKLLPHDPSEAISTPGATGQDLPFAIPSAWTAIPLGDALHMINGRAFKPTDWLPKGLPIVRIQNLNNATAPFNFCNPETVDGRHLIDDEEFLISWSGTPGTSFGAFIWRRGKAALNQHIFKCLPKTKLYTDRFLQIAINGRLDEIIAKAHGGVGLQHITKGKLESLVLPVPPLAEQHRIVAKVDELMALCDRLEAAQGEREARRDRLVSASLARVTVPDGTDATSTTNSARFHLDHFARLTTRPEHIKQLRQTILNLAVRGQLVSQDPSEKPLAIQSTADVSDDPDKRLTLMLPSGWQWVRVRDVAEARLGKMLDKAKNRGRQFKYLRNTNVHWFEVRTDEVKTMALSDDEAGSFLLKEGDVLICEGGHGIARTAVWRGEIADMAFQKALHRVRPSQALNGDFFAYCINVYYQSDVLQRLFTGVGIPHFTGVALSKLVFPLPPLAEQRRIVAKVDELMVLCDQLEASLASAAADRARLLEALLHEVLAPAA